MKTHLRQPIYLEASVAALVPAATFSLIRIFESRTDVIPLMAAALVSSLICFAARWIGLSLFPSLILSLSLLTLIAGSVYASETTVAGIIPTPETFSGFRDLAVNTVNDFNNQAAPIEATDSFLFSGFIISWLMTFLTDWGAMRLRLAFEAALPAVLIFILASVETVNTGKHTLLTTVILGLAIGMWAVSQRYRRISSDNLVVSKPNKLNGSLRTNNRLVLAIFASGLSVIIVAVSVGAAWGRFLPYAEESAILSFNNTSRVREVSNPFIDLEQRLVEQSDQSLFTVTSSERSYWRIVGLDKYRNVSSSGGDASVWEVKLGGDDKKETKFIQPEKSLGTPLEQTISIGSLDLPSTGSGSGEPNVWVPAAMAPTRILDDGGAPLKIDDITQTITNSEDGTTSLDYVVLSNTPSYTAEQLITASQNLSPQAPNSDILVELPEKPIPDSVKALAREITSDSDNRYEKVVALQQYFQDFDYDTNLPPRTQGTDIIEHFLETRVGFCQQFSGTFAIMARELGIPARVAVGLLGEMRSQTKTEKSLIRLRGNTHTLGLKFGLAKN